MNLTICYALLLTASRQYIEASLLELLAALAPAAFAPSDLGPGGGGSKGKGAEAEAGQWVPGRDGWPRAVARNALRTLLVLFTAGLCLAVPHFALLSGLVGGLTDSLLALVLPPLLYVAESRRAALPRPRAGGGYAAVGGGAGAVPGTGASGSRDALELVACSALGAFGVGFIVFATRSNLAAIEAFVATPTASA
jgi:hypothetical protein